MFVSRVVPLLVVLGLSAGSGGCVGRSEEDHPRAGDGASASAEPADRRGGNPARADQSVDWANTVVQQASSAGLRVSLVVGGAEVEKTARLFVPPGWDEGRARGVGEWRRQRDAYMAELRSELKQRGLSEHNLDTVIDGEMRRDQLNAIMGGIPRPPYRRRLRLEAEEESLQIVERYPSPGRTTKCSLLRLFLDSGHDVVEYMSAEDIRSSKSAEPPWVRLHETSRLDTRELLAVIQRAHELDSCLEVMVTWQGGRTWGELARMLVELDRVVVGIVVQF